MTRPRVSSAKLEMIAHHLLMGEYAATEQQERDLHWAVAALLRLDPTDAAILFDKLNSITCTPQAEDAYLAAKPWVFAEAQYREETMGKEHDAAADA